jgi:hypothetical protein
MDNLMILAYARLFLRFRIKVVILLLIKMAQFKELVKMLSNFFSNHLIIYKIILNI